MSKQIFHRIQLRRICRQKRHLNVTIKIVKKFLNQATLVDSQAVPNDEKFFPYLRCSALRNSMHWGARMAPGNSRKYICHQLTPAITDKCFQLKLYCRTGVCPLGAQVRTSVGLSDRPDSSTNTITRPCFMAFFLTWARFLFSMPLRPGRPAGVPGERVVAD
jgi:hypothetical protein